MRHDPTEALIRLSALQAKAAKEAERAGAACVLLDSGVHPDMLRGLGWPIVEVMDAVLREEAKIRRQMEIA